MVGKLTTVLTKREAEAYRSQGLHKEALGLYKNLLSSSPNLGDGFKDAIQGQMESIQSELHDGPPQESQMLSSAEIKRIKKGWGANATEGDLLVCAQAFCQVGQYQDAFSEATKLLQQGCAVNKVVDLFATCLVHLHPPAQLAETIGPLVQNIFTQPQARLHFHILLTEGMVKLKQPVHAQALYQHLKQHPIISKKAPQRLSAIATGIEQLQASQKAEEGHKAPGPEIATADTTNKSTPPPTEPHSPEADDTTSCSWFSSIKKYFSKQK